MAERKGKTNRSTPISEAQRLEWFHEARFGLFVHYGLYSLLQRGEWVMFNERIPPIEYARLADRFAPKPDAAQRWAQAAVRAGAKYIVFTARHHDGFCLFDTRSHAFSSPRTRCGRDIVAEFVSAARDEGLRVGIYYSLIDWREPGYFEPDRHPESRDRLVAVVHDQVRELMTNYGRIDLLWYDGDWVSHGLVEVDRAAFWKARALNAMVRKLQPHILINNRCGIRADIDTPEQHVVASEPGRGWESCMTIGDSAGWGYVRHSPNMKSSSQLLQNLCTAASGEGNFLLNIGPKPDGSIRREETSRLRAMGDWLNVNGRSIYGSQRCDLPDQRLPGAPIGTWSRTGMTAYLHVYRWPGPELVVAPVDMQIERVTLLGSTNRLRCHIDRSGRCVITGLPKRPPHPSINTIAFSCKSIPRRRVEEDRSAWLAMKQF
jgi:alpha-L-fucosidase